jgi:hypothetical protein
VFFGGSVGLLLGDVQQQGPIVIHEFGYSHRASLVDCSPIA